MSRVLAICLTVPALAAPAAGAEAGHGPMTGLTGDDPSPVALSRVSGSRLREATVPLAGSLEKTARGWRSDRVDTTAYSMLGLTWRGGDLRAAARTHGSDGWSRWQPLEPLKPRAGDQRGSELLWVPGSNGFQVRVSRSRDELALVLLDPRRLEGDVAPTAVPPGEQTTRAPRPRLLTRDDWGADETWRNGDPFYLRTIKQVHIHHTATGNDYRRADVAGLIRGMYRYHTHSLGWSDLGYNFLVDRFGRTWVGRAGGYRRAVRGAHTLGFNHSSTGLAVIGNYQSTGTSADARRALVRLAAWKLDLYERQPAGWTWITSHGSDLFAEGERVRLRVIDGHRDTNQTACPGNLLYDRLPGIRVRAQVWDDAYEPAP